MLILSVDTSTSAGSVAIIEDKDLVGELYLQLKTTHSERVLNTIDTLLEFSRIDITDIDIFVASLGPGSFTGIRIGLSILKGFAAVSKKPLVGISSLDALAMEFKGEGEFAAFIEGRREEVFYSVYRKMGGDLKQIQDYSVANREIIKTFPKNIGVFNSNDFFNFSLKGNLFAHNFALLGYKKFISTEDKSIFQGINILPMYLKKSDAEIKQNQR